MEYNISTHINGNLVLWDEEKERWLYIDGTDAWQNPRPCPKCNQLPTPEGHDACLGQLPGVEYACCGHGVSQGYISFTNGKVIRFPDSKMDE